MKTIKVMLLLFILVTITGCEQTVSRHFGGNMTITLNPGERLIEATWKNDDIWYLTEPMDSDYIPKTKVFKESALFGVFNGTVTFIESK